MNINRLYLAQIFICTEIEDDYDNYVIMFNQKFYGQKKYGKFCKKTIVYHDKNDQYIDIQSGEKYKKNFEYDLKVGEMCINVEEGIIPINQLPQINFKRKNMSKRKILKKLSNTSLYNKKEEDK